ncbi:uncharacterized protein LOC141647139 [Silene latifolia]|uniref:uncharacterized protein LOC141647139 n=1 Tax=Silene latifolia TaxID=37657 RepID=UPI003D77B150
MSMLSIWRQITRTNTLTSTTMQSPVFLPVSSRFFSTSSPYLVKVGIPEFLRGIANGVEAHVEKLESEFGDLQKLPIVCTLGVFGLRDLEGKEREGEQRKLILKYAQKYRVGLWRPRADQVKVQLFSPTPKTSTS